MVVITVLLKNNPQFMQFYFEHFKDADKVLQSIEELQTFGRGSLLIEDDYGGKGIISWVDVAGLCLTDYEKEIEAKEKLEWEKIQMQVRLQKKLQESPAAKLLVPQQGLRQ